MIFTAENILLIGSILILSSILISKTGYRFGIPTLLLFLVVGMLFGSDGLGLQFHSASDAQFIGMIALSIILFSGGMDTKYADIRPVLKPGIVLSTLGRAPDHFAHRSVHLLDFGMGQHQHPIASAHFDAAGRHHVVNRLCLRVQSSALTEHESEAEPPAHARAGKRKQRPDGLHAYHHPHPGHIQRKRPELSDCRKRPADPVLFSEA